MAIVAAGELFDMKAALPPDLQTVLRKARATKVSGMLFAGFVVNTDKVSLRRSIAATMKVVSEGSVAEQLLATDFVPILWEKAQAALSFRKA